MWSLCVLTLSPLYDPSPEESLHVLIELLAIESAGVKVLVVVKVVISIVKLNRPGSRCSEAVVGQAVGGSNATVHL